MIRKTDIKIATDLTNKVIDLNELRIPEYCVCKNIGKILRKIFEDDNIELEIGKECNIKSNISDFNVFLNGRTIANVKVRPLGFNNKVQIMIKNDKNCYYCHFDYYAQINDGYINISLYRANFEYNEVKYDIINSISGETVDIKTEEKGISFEMQSNLNDTEFSELIISIDVDDDLKTIYSKLEEKLTPKEMENIKIKKYNIVDGCNSSERITDLLILNNGELDSFLTKISKNGKDYQIKKDTTNYQITLFDSSIEDLNSLYFNMNNQIKFIKKLERKKEDN